MKTISDNPYINEEVKKVISQFDTLYTEKNTAGIKNNIKIAKRLASDVASTISQIHIYYSIATAFGDILHLESSIYSEEMIIDQLYNFRMAIDCSKNRKFSDEEIPYVAGCLIQLYTNYANALSNMGRVIEAIRYYKKALSIHKDFGMAEGNLGIEYIYYADLDYDKGHSRIFHYVGYKYLKLALKHKKTIVKSKVIACFQKKIDMFTSEYVQGFLEKDLNLGKYSLGRKKEADYRTWVMNHGLFLNTMNDLPFKDNFMAADVLHLPNIIN
jgi:tetratricopeptide (TPR) repeat protein